MLKIRAFAAKRREQSVSAADSRAGDTFTSIRHLELAAVRRGEERQRQSPRLLTEIWLHPNGSWDGSTAIPRN